MIEQLITDHLGLWTSAVRAKSSAGRGSNSKLELAGIKKLRELILELAVRGKLVPQDPNDEPASELLVRIATEKAQLIKEGVIRKSKPLSEIKNEEKIIDLPMGWTLARLNDLGDWGAGATPSRGNSAFYGGGIPWFKSGELTEGYLYASEETITELALSKSSLRYNAVGDVLVAMYGATIGKTAILGVKATTNQAVCACTPFNGFLNLYLLLVLKAYKPRLVNMGAGGAQPNISREKIISTVIGLPPVTEQHRIVAKVDELMTLCDQLEQKSETALAAHQTLVETLLATLTDSADAAELAQNWQRLAAHFDLLFTTESSIDALKQTILQLAVMGKLVAQDPNDEPASVLLERIAAEKARLVKEGKIKKEKPLPPISEDEKPFALPAGWEWGRLADMFQFLNGYAFKSEWFSPSGVRLLRNINISHGHTKWDDEVYLSCGLQDEYERFKLELGDVVISLDRPIINTGLKYAIIRESDLPCLLLQRVAKFHSVGELVSTKFLPLWLESQTFMNAIDPGRSNGIPHISTKQLELIFFPILSLAEQQRIVSKVDELMSLCNQLSARLQASQTTQLQLAEALVEGALN